MKEKFSDQPLRGMADRFPPDLREENWILNNIREISKKYAYEEFETPLLEPVDIYAAKSSEELINEQSFIFESKKQERLILRPELTPSLARMISRKSQEMKKPIRWFSIPICYRYERPQRGRAREFKQVNFDILGDIGIMEEIEIINITTDIFTSFGATSNQFQIFYNNRRLVDAIYKFILKIPENYYMKIYKALDKSDKLEEDEYQKYLRDTFNDEKLVDNILQLNGIDDIKNLPYDNIPNDFFNSRGYKEIKRFQELLEATKLEEYCTFSAGVVRGLDYYTGTVFEVFDMGEKNRRSIFGGGRYDDLLDLFSNEQISGMGFGMGLLSLKLFLRTYNLIPEKVKEFDYSNIIYLTTFNEELAHLSIQLAQKLRDVGFGCLIDYSCGKLRNQISKANDLNCKLVAIIGPQEQEDKSITFKNLLTNTQKSLKLKDLNKNVLEDLLEK
jgi:histidyl-tRNA synthetase